VQFRFGNIRTADCGGEDSVVFVGEIGRLFVGEVGKAIVDLTVKESAHKILENCVSKTQSRTELWIEFIRSAEVRRMVEVGVYQGEFAKSVLQQSESVAQYYMVDPWKHLDNWNKPSNQNDTVFEQFFRTTKARTEFAANRRVILQEKPRM
jgi:hypothetical protein